MGCKITFTPRFDKSYKKLSKIEKQLVREKVNRLAKNPLHPSLRTKRIKGTIDLFECSVNMDIRIIWNYESDSMILLLDVGHHDILNQY